MEKYTIKLEYKERSERRLQNICCGDVKKEHTKSLTNL
jgi:hypothetical protein